MNPSELRSLIRETLLEVNTARPYADAQSDQERFQQLANRPQSPKLTPEQSQQTVQQFQSLPKDRQQVIAAVMKHPCSSCEQELKIPNVGWSHGMCPRHQAEFRKTMNLPHKESKGETIDMKTLSPEETKLAVNLFAVAKVQGSKF